MGIYRTFKIAHHAHRRVIAEGQELHHNNRADAALRIDPVESITDAAPGQTPGGSPGVVRLWVDEKSKAKSVALARVKIDTGRSFRHGGANLSRIKTANVVGRHGANGTRLKDLFPVRGQAAPEDHLCEFRVVIGGGE